MKNTRRHVISIVFVLLALGGTLGTVFALDLEPRLGLDLSGGTSVTLTAPASTEPEILEKTVEVLRTRIDRAGVAEPEITREGSNNVLIQLPGTEDRERLLKLIGQTAQLQFRQVLQTLPEGDPNFASATASADDNPETEVVLPDEDGTTLYRLSKAELTGDAVRRATAAPNPETGAWEIAIDFRSQGDKQWEAFTGKLACLQGEQRQIAIVLDATVESSPQVDPSVECNKGISGGRTQVTGSFEEQEAKDLALVLTTGALPVELEQSEVRTVSPTLGREALNAGLVAGAVGLGLVMLYVVLYYRTLGLQTWIGLLVFSSLIYGLVVLFGKWIGWNLTLSGIAGLIVAVGIATDSYIVFFERIKEEIHEGRSLRVSIDRGFIQAWRTMRTANAVTILAAVVLYFLAVGPVRGFALALGIATSLDLVITYLLTWPLAALLARSKFFAENRFLGMTRALEGGDKEGSLLRKIYRSEFSIDFIGRRRTWFLISGAISAIAIASLVPGIRGLTYGIDFKGGTIYRAPAESDVSIGEVKSALAAEGLTNVVVQRLTDRLSGKAQIQVQTEEAKSEDTAIIQALATVTGAQVSDVDTEKVGEKWGSQITTKALRGLGIFLVLVILYMSWRLEPKMAVAGIVALLHDLLITAGIYALVGFEVTPATVIATLTILGYSLYDTVVVFDKIKENLSSSTTSRQSFAEIANDSTNHVLMRSVNTSLTVLLPVGSLLVVGSFLLGADTLKDLALALFIGIAAGTFSSIFVATPILSILKEKEPRFAGKGRTRTAERPVPETAPAIDIEGTREVTPVTERRPSTQYVRGEQRKKQSRAKRKKGRR